MKEIEGQTDGRWTDMNRGGREEKSGLGNREFLQQIGKESGDEIWIVTLLFC